MHSDFSLNNNHTRYTQEQSCSLKWRPEGSGFLRKIRAHLDLLSIPQSGGKNSGRCLCLLEREGTLTPKGGRAFCYTSTEYVRFPKTTIVLTLQPMIPAKRVDIFPPDCAMLNRSRDTFRFFLKHDFYCCCTRKIMEI